MTKGEEMLSQRISPKERLIEIVDRPLNSMCSLLIPWTSETKLFIYVL